MSFSGMDSIGKTLMVIGCILLIIGVILHFGGKIFPFGRLPGDINVEKTNFSFHFPVVTCLIISIVLTIVLNLLFKR